MRYYKDNIPTIYELKGKTLRAALEINALMKDELLKDIRPLSEVDDVALFTERNKDLLAQIGQFSPAISIHGNFFEIPRAYHLTPQCYFDPKDKNRVYLFCPHSYDDTHFVPEHGRKLGDDEVFELENRATTDPDDLLSLDHYMNMNLEPVWFTRVARGVRLPDDFDMSYHEVHINQTECDVIKAQADIITGMLNLRQAFHTSGLFKTNIDDAKTIIFGLLEPVLDKSGKCDTVRVYAYDAETMTEIALQSTDSLRVAEGTDGHYMVTPNLRTAGGMVVQGMINNFVSKIPDLKAAWERTDREDVLNNVVPPPKPLHFDGPRIPIY